MNNTNDHSNACVIIIWKSYGTIDYVTWVLRVLNSTRRGSQKLPTDSPFRLVSHGFRRVISLAISGCFGHGDVGGLVGSYGWVGLVFPRPRQCRARSSLATVSIGLLSSRGLVYAKFPRRFRNAPGRLFWRPPLFI
jgi:hypothetical protein